MDQLVVLSLGNGDLHHGFPAVTAQLWESSNPRPIKFTGRLPAAPAIPELYRYWQLLYSALYHRLDWCPRIEIEAVDVTNVSQVEFSDLCQQLSNSVNAWLNSEPFRNIDQQLRTQLDPAAEIRFIIETNHDLLQRLPWHLWKFFEHYPKAEVALSAPEYKLPNKSPTKTPSAKVQILAILGNGQGIEIGRDRTFLEQLSNQAEIKFLVEPQLEELNEQLWQQGWDILFFAGHSSSQETGLLQLNQIDSLTLDQLRYALKKAISRGLKLAIFNSCDGLGLAKSLAGLHIPQVIVMREPVPDVVAQEFLRYFLAAFSRGQSLYTSVREARERLQGLERDFPCATWLPVICQNPAEMPTTWQEWCASKEGDSATSRTEQRHRQVLSSRRSLRGVLLVSVAVTALVMGVRQLGMLQSLELRAFDQLLRLRPNEGPDPRLLIVTVTEKDVQNQNPQERRSASLSDRALAKLLQKLQPFQPQVIGLDIYRDFPVDPKQTDLKTQMQHNKRLIAACEVGGGDEYLGIKPPPEVPQERISFSDFPIDPDQAVRRQLLGMSKDDQSSCITDTSFSFRVAQTYLATKGIRPERTLQGDLRMGRTVFQKLEPSTGGYQHLDALGYQVLLNYRASNSIAKQVTLSSILSDSLRAELPHLVKDRIVLIGTTAKSFKDYFATPYSSGQWPQEMPGILIQAHAVSQILSAVLDQRPLLWWFPAWGETLWVWGWSVVGGALVWYFRSPSRLGLASGAALVTLCGLCFVFLLKGGWVPLVPSALALVITGTSVMASTVFQARPKRL